MQNDTNVTFNGLGIAPKLMEILDRSGFKNPTPIQKQSIPVAIEGKDLIGIAQTGTGKTLAFGIPMLQQLAIKKCKGLVLLPTRELAVQVDESLRRLGKHLGLKTAVVIGGESMQRQIKNLRMNPHVIIATPGRLIDLLDTKHVDLKTTGVLVLDEADRMLDMGFAPQLKRILPHLPKERQTMLFSATMDESVSGIVSSFMKIPTRIEVAPAGSTASKITQEIIIVNREDKPSLLKKTLEEYTGSTLVFTRTKFGAKKINRILKVAGISAAEIHSDRSLSQRLEALQGFKLGKYRVLVATDIAARGIDVNNIQLVINYDLPENAADYVHRIGRTARAGKEGHAISFATSDQQSDVRAIERLIKISLPVKRSPKMEADPNAPAEDPREYARPRMDRGSRGNFGSRPPRGGSRFGDRSRRSSSDRPSFGGDRRKSGPSRGPKPFGRGPRTGARRFSNNGGGYFGKGTSADRGVY